MQGDMKQNQETQITAPDDFNPASLCTTYRHFDKSLLLLQVGVQSKHLPQQFVYGEEPW